MVSGYTPLEIAGKVDANVEGGGALQDGEGAALIVNDGQQTSPAAEATRTNSVVRTVVASLFMISLLALGLSAENSKELHLLQAQVAKQEIFAACTDSTTWKDSLGNPCDHYARNYAARKNGCAPYGSREDMRGTGGQLPSEACCASCGVPDVCTDSTTWRDKLGNPCDHYARNFAANKNGCAPYGSREDMRGTGGLLPSEACCTSCGVPTKDEPVETVEACTDSVRWRDALGNNCDHYARNFAKNNNGCAPYGSREDMRGTGELKWLPSEACCASCSVPTPKNAVQLTMQDCGNAHAKFTKLNQNSLTIGEATTLISSGTVDEDINSGTFKMTVTHIHSMHAGGRMSMEFTGDVCVKKKFNVPHAGYFEWLGLTCPVKKGPIDVSVGMKIESYIPTSMASADIKLEATGSSPTDKLLCKTISARP